MKQQHIIKLIGYKQDSTPARINAEVEVFLGNGVTISPQGNSVLLSTDKGEYTVPFDTVLNIYKGVANGLKVHISLKKITGKLIYWS